MKERFKKVCRFLLNPRLVLCVAIAWLLTNGWSYIVLAVGTWLDMEWMKAVAGAYLAFLWVPCTPEKLVTFAIAIALLRWLFPQDEKTLAVLRRWYEKAKNAVLRKKAERAERKNIKNK